MKFPVANGGDVDDRECEDRIEMSRDGPVVVRQRTHRAPIRSRWSRLGELAHRRTRLGVEKDSVRADKLERVPFDGIVTRGQDQASAGVMIFNRHLHSGRRGDANVNHIDTNRLEASDRGAREHFARRARIASEHHGRSAIAAHPRAERGGVAGDEFGRQILAHDAAHAGNGDHQSIRHRAQS